jgi:peroxiredoxin
MEKHLVKRSPVRVTVPRLNARIGQPAANFLFEYAPGREMPLAKLKGQSVVVVFWKSAAKASIQAVRDLQVNAARSKPAPLVLAVNDGDDPQVARAVATESGITATLVTDPKRGISAAYGVSLWPTIVRISPSGAVTGIGYGYVPEGQVLSPSSAAGLR